MTLTIGVKLDPQKTSFLFSEYVPYQMMKIVAQPQAFLHPLVQKIRIYDSKHNTEYFKTYKTYMLAGKDKKYAADRLSIHLNTLKYRLNMIDDLFYAGSLSKREELHIVFSFLLDDFENGAAIDSSL